ncbi:MAG: thioredoxin family protein, partial [Pseudobdellovibrio sp.]
MLDSEMKAQLTEVFSSLENPIELIYDLSSHSNQSELIEMLEDLVSTSSKITTRASGQNSEAPRFTIYKSQRPTGITFTGIPGGHEFTSLILAILNSDGKGKMPDAGLSTRIKNLKGPIRIKTYISLTCENCPDVVQALNQMALVHSDFQHEMVDGGYVQNEVDAIGIQGVPSVVVDSKMIHSGRIHFLDLLAKLEEKFGTEVSGIATAQPQNLGHYDVVVIGGGPAGASAAIYSARKGLKTALLAERMGGQVQDTKGIENLISV